jgi:NADH-quinone oxidoreductase subunit A
MNNPPIPTITLWPLAVYFCAVAVLAAGMIGLSYVLGERHQDQATGEPYESGIVSTGSARQRLSAKFYLNAMFFVIFDLESVFIFAWAVAIRELGWAGYVEAVIFIGVLFIALVYLWRLGGLDWGEARLRQRTRPTQIPAVEEMPIPVGRDLQSLEQGTHPTQEAQSGQV